MANAAIVVLAGNETHADYGRIANALEATKEFVETDGDEDEDSDYHPLYQAVRDHASVCDFCPHAFDVTEAVEESGLATLAEYDGHPSIRSLVDDDYEIITF